MRWPFSAAAQVRVWPFAVFMLLLELRGWAPADGSWGIDPRWIYGLSVGVVGAMLLYWRREYGELAAQQRPLWPEVRLAIGVGLAVFVLWIQLDAPWMQLAAPAAPYTPLDEQGAVIWPLVVVRWIGAALLVPVMEELFWRSFLMRWFQHETFQGVAPQQVGVRAVVLSTFVFMLAHTLWLAAIVAGLAYAWLYRRTGRLWVAVIAHAVTNGALGIWVVTTGRWAFW